MSASASVAASPFSALRAAFQPSGIKTVNRASTIFSRLLGDGPITFKRRLGEYSDLAIAALKRP